ncbi:hypothetical protein [Pseudonocardia sp. D17]|uniref:hypothetical protein n=1 Tax=Pseudonocardia sp. D17 TaxID=882661 RepID=UPI002B3816F6|nr:hypothetical protein PSD17_39570 [Pseudonocardia sp. D17]
MADNDDRRPVDPDEAARAARIAALVDAAPPLTPEQRRHVRDILAGVPRRAVAIPDAEDDDEG